MVPKGFLASAAALALGVFASLPAMAQGKSTLRVADTLPVGHPTVEYMTKYWMDAVTAASDGEVKFEYYPAGQLGKAQDLLALTQRGVADISGFVPSNVLDKMPLSAVAELPGAFDTSCAGTMAYLKLIREGALAKHEFAQNGVRALFTIVLPPYQLFATKPVGGLKDVAGLKVRTLGGAHELTLTKLKAVPVRLAAPELYDALGRGTVDGVIVPHRTVLNYNWNDHVKHGTIGLSLGSGLTTYVISETLWTRLSEKVRAAMIKAGFEASKRACEFYDGDVQNAIDTLKQKGMTLGEWTADDRKALTALTGSVAAEWASALDARGKPGTEVLKAFEEALRQ